jgi:hypothetical protein
MAAITLHLLQSSKAELQGLIPSDYSDQCPSFPRCSTNLVFIKTHFTKQYINTITEFTDIKCRLVTKHRI